MISSNLHDSNNRCNYVREPWKVGKSGEISESASTELCNALFSTTKKSQRIWRNEQISIGKEKYNIIISKKIDRNTLHVFESWKLIQREVNRESRIAKANLNNTHTQPTNLH